MKNNFNIGCVVVPLVVAMFLGLYLLSYLPNGFQWSVGVIFAIVLMGIVIFARFFSINISKR